MSRSHIWGVIIIFGVASAFLSALVFGLLVATILTLIITPVLLAAPAVFHQACVARRERRIIAKMVEAASTGEGGPDNAMTHAAAE
jgi:multisubunit Na+/H+ antiporter MnhG subunit